MPSSIAYQATILQGNATSVAWKNTGTVDVSVGSLIVQGKICGVVTGPSSSDGSTVVSSTLVGSATFTPGLKILMATKTADTPAAGVQAFFDTTNTWLTTNSTASFVAAGVFAFAKTSGTGMGEFFLNEGVAN